MESPSLSIGEYEHYKGKRYQVVGVACHSETGEFLVIYRPLYEHVGQPAIWARPYDMFIESLVIGGRTIPRFKKVPSHA